MVEIKLTNTYAYVVSATPNELDLIYTILAVKDPRAVFIPAYKKGYWDGWVRFFDRKTNAFPSGLLQTLRMRAGAIGVNLSVQDDRSAPDNLDLKPLHLNGIDPFSFPYDYQADVIWKAIGEVRGVLELCTNSGKSGVMAGIMQVIDQPALIFTHTLILLHQTWERMVTRLGCNIGLIGDGVWAPDKFTVGMVQSISNRLAAENQDCLDYLSGIKVLLVDEAHHLAALTWYEIFLKANAFWRIGLSGTAFQDSHVEDYRLMGATGPLIPRIENKTLIERGISSRPTVWTVENHDSVNRGASFQQAYRQGIEESVSRNSLVCKVACKFIRQNKQVFMMVTRISQGEILQRILDASGYATAFIWGTTPAKTRRQVLQDFKTRNGLDCVISSTICDEGMDVPAIDVLILAGGGVGKTRLLQRIGRALRKKDGVNVCDIVDFWDFSHPTLLKHSRKRIRICEKEGFEVREWAEGGREGGLHQTGHEIGNLYPGKPLKNDQESPQRES
jgi:superfamily II DNA or RNA helicase